MVNSASHALDGLRVLEIGDGVGVPYCGKLLADLGADVVKIEPPAGDSARHSPPFLHNDPHPEKSGLFLYLNTSKRGITLDLTQAAGRRLLDQLVAEADILLHDRRPLDQPALGLTYERLSARRPELVVVAITPFGQTGPRANWLGTDLTAVNAGGLAFITPPGGSDPDLPPLWAPGRQAEFIGALHGALSALTAIWVRPLNEGRGQLVDISLQEGLASILEATTAFYAYHGQVRTRHHPILVQPLVLLPCRDGHVYICCAEEHQWQRFVELMSNPEWADLDGPFGTRQGRAENADILATLLEEWTLEHDRDWIYHESQARRIPNAPVNTMADLVASPHLAARDYWVTIDRAHTGPLRYPGAPYRPGGTPWAIRRPAPTLGEHNAEVYTALGYAPADLVRLRAMGAI